MFPKEISANGSMNWIINTFSVSFNSFKIFHFKTYKTFIQIPNIVRNVSHFTCQNSLPRYFWNSSCTQMTFLNSLVKFRRILSTYKNNYCLKFVLILLSLSCFMLNRISNSQKKDNLKDFGQKLFGFEHLQKYINIRSNGEEKQLQSSIRSDHIVLFSYKFTTE